MTRRQGETVFQGFAQLAQMTTTERDAITAANGMEIYNTTTESREQYVDGAWKANNAPGLKLGLKGSTVIPSGGIYDLDVVLDKKGYTTGLLFWSGVSSGNNEEKGGVLSFGKDNKFHNVEAAEDGPGAIYAACWDSEAQVGTQASHKWLNTGGTAWIKQVQLSTDGGTLEIDVQGTVGHSFAMYYRIMTW